MKSIRSVDIDGTIRYKNANGELHREDGPAYEEPSGYKEWHKNGQCHREDGPAIIYSDGDIDYYLNGKWYSVEEWEQELLSRRLRRLKDL